MSKLNYTLDQVWSLEPEFKTLVGDVCKRMLSVPNWREVDFKESFSVDGTSFDFIFKTSGIVPLLDQIPQNDPTVVTATTFLHGRPYVFGVQLSDFEKETPLDDELHNRITTDFIGCVVANMARRWYSEDGMRERVHAFAQVEGFDYIVDHIDGRLHINYTEYGYMLSFINEPGDVLYHVEHHDKLTPENPKNPYKAIFLRHLDDLIVKLLALEKIWQGSWSKTLN
ncbi:alpha-1,6-mannosylglycoprotein 6-beta-N-acetylglucosaminyltransferase A [Kosakonia phage Kc263]|uniref:Alpha-1,6-mannosylglycoprotein 6-beta-N-acetylglucosaminyltransferase A n=1 Tax=Kosakonia phage Kc263 TaxID=2863194 RepID=A0AAE7WFV2_9CAUD|nr:alpha-1,6-mannosylglycoprotein 6-beta-N-acetylglucosaminyltransferase A [Kosakonia phage Kc263]QYN80050.1 alpha-1,6-mannosylglycoprotein 6-beta-N-acetylglucosaminyltransferase A [Kosakonia phage Kc263]